MKVSLLIPTYKDLGALKLILQSLEKQTYKDFEVLVAEDDESTEVKNFLENYESTFIIKHLFHENIGNRKAIIMNKALLKSDGAYIIFIDGDTIPYSTFIASHVALSEVKTVLCGRRVNLGDKVSLKLRSNKLTAFDLEKKYFRHYFYINDDNVRHYEQGIHFKPNWFIQKLLTKYNKNAHILASNFSCFKEDIFSVNGFDEALPYAPNRDDTDLEWRMIGLGCKMKSVKFCANMFHLNHERTDRTEEEKVNMEIILKKQQRHEYVAKNGIEKL